MWVGAWGEGKEKGTYIHDVVEYYERGSLCLGLVPDAYLPDAPVTPEKVVQVLACNLIIQVLDEKYAVGPGRQLGLREEMQK